MKRKSTWIGVAVAAVVALALTVAVTGAKVITPIDKSMCAEFSDAVGLYPGNKVQLLGIDVGSVTAIANKPDYVQVDFTVPSDLDLPADVGALTYSQSIVADRHVELTKPYAGGPKFSGPQCIKLVSTKTPISVSQTFSAVDKLAGAILGTESGQDPMRAPGAEAINQSLAALSHSLEGTGPGINQTLRDLVTLIGDPNHADTDYRNLLANSEILTSELLQHWDTVATVLQTLPESLRMIEGLSTGFGVALSHLSHALPLLVEALNRFAPRAYNNIGDKLVPWLRDVLTAYTPQIVGLINALPPVTNWVASQYQPDWGSHNVTYLPPQVRAVAPAQASAICDVLQQRNIPGAAAACAPGASSDAITFGLTDLLLGAAS
ncbi:mammalian cell entry protein [Mycobacterium asiaticum]|uniref:Mammalian cell entry protein n=1 Tax=Mycobacterium asiaticum TaxID=1790 RepID=A0A1A3PCJ7_MYCAS|nr:MlaD family protein [Mycobacterium asiaticum]OBK30322.1 mammalian cell entry protein [Mycobacterium asiaticum]